MRDLKLPDGRERLVRHGHGPERTIQTGIGPVAVAGSRSAIAARRAMRTGSASTSAILPKWARRTRSLDALLPILYLRGLSTGDFQEALAALLGKDAPNLSPSVITRLTGEWQAEYERWQARDLSARRYVYVWADGVYLQARMEDHAECMLVLIGATPKGKKELVGFQAGVRESAQSWRELLVEIKRRGLTIPPRIAVGDGALGFWKALDELFPGTPSEVLAAQDRQRAQQGPEVRAAGDEGRPAGDLSRAHPRRPRSRRSYSPRPTGRATPRP